MNDLEDTGPAAVAGPRRRYLTVVFSDLSDSTRLGASLEAEHYAALLTDLRKAFHEVLQRFGGMVVRIQGDGVLAIFGYPEIREDDARRATEAVLELHKTVRGFAPQTGGVNHGPLTLHSGIHSGLVLLDDGDLVRGRFELLGNVPNIAARLSDEAGRDEIWVSEETLGPELGYFDASQCQYVTLKGRSEPLAVHRILGLAGGSASQQVRRRRSLLPFIGRGEALRELGQYWQDVLQGQPRCVAVLAEAGVGKTRLVDEFLMRQPPQHCRVVRGYCENTLSAEPFQPFLQMLREVFGLHHGLPTARALEQVDHWLESLDPGLKLHRAVLLRALSLPTGSESGTGSQLTRRVFQAEELVQALRELLAALARRGPLLLFIDDWQWADEASRQTLAALRTLTAVPIGLLFTTRELVATDANLLGAEVLALTPFSEEEALQTVQHLLPGLDPFEVAAIQRYSGGNPLFIEELCHSMGQGGNTHPHPHPHYQPHHPLAKAHTGVAWLRVLIESRLSRLPTAQVELLRAAAVIGNVVPTWLLEVVTGCAEDHPLVRSLAELDFIFPGERAQTLRFKHGITRDVIYDSVGLHARQAMHLRIAQAIQQQAHASGAPEESFEVLAYHYSAAGEAERAARFAGLAAEKALAASALDRAKAHFHAALKALDRLPPSHERMLQWIGLAQRLGLACVFDASREDLGIFQRALDLSKLCDDPCIHARAHYWLGYIEYALGDARQAVQHGEQALALAERADDEPLAVQIRATLGQAHASAAHYDAALDLLDNAAWIKRQHRSGRGPAVGLAYTLACQATVLADRGDFAGAHARFEEALGVIGEARHEVGASVRGLWAAVLLWQGHWERARHMAAEAYRIGEQVRSLFSFSMSRAAGSYAAWQLDSSDAALQGLVDATAWLAAREGGLFESLNHGWLTDIYVTRGEVTLARQHAARAWRRGRRLDWLGGAMAARAMAWCLVQQGESGAALRWLRRAEAAALTRQSAHEVAHNHLYAARLAAYGVGSREQGLARLDQAMTAFQAMDMPWHQAQAQWLYPRLA